MRRMALLLLVLVAAVPATGAPASDPQANDVVVTGSRLTDTERALAACIARKCPPDQEIAATLAHAENQFIAGDYAGARATLRRGISRNGRHAAAFPVPVSDLHRASATIAVHLGRGESYRFESYEAVSALRAGLPKDDPRVLDTQLQVGTMLARLEDFRAAVEVYADVAARAHALDLADVEGLARLRLATAYSAYALVNRDYLAKAGRFADALATNTDPRFARYARAGRILKTRLAIRDGNQQAVDELIAESRLDPTDVPALIYAPVPDLDGFFLTISGRISSRTIFNFADQWVDIAFYVLPDGRVDDPGVIRRSPKLSSEAWLQPLLASVAKRRYAALKLDPRDPGLLRVERYTLTSRYVEGPGTRLDVRDGIPRLEMLDLSVSSKQRAAN